MSTNRCWLPRIAAQAAVLLIALELAGAVLFALTTGGLVWRSRETAGTTRQSPFASAALRPVLHPYFGNMYAEREGTNRALGLTFNNHGFFQDRGYTERHPDCCDLPLRRSEKDVVIALLGGSVAAGTAFAAQADDHLDKKLAALPRFSGRRVRTLNLAVPGGKQPQQLIILAYYLSLGQRFDYVVTIDGLNEILFGPDNAEQGIAPTFPNAPQWLRLVDYIDGQLARPTPTALRSAYHELTARSWMERAQACRTGICYGRARIMAAWHGWGIAPRTTEQSARGGGYVRLDPAPAGDAVAQSADAWAGGVRALHRLATAYGIPFVAVLQPNQWDRQGGQFQPRGADPYTPRVSRSVPPGYEALRARMAGLVSDGVPIEDATRIFDGPDQSMYSDDCCHFTPAGYRRLLDAAVRRIGRD